MDEDQLAEAAPAEREEETRVGARALTRKLNSLESRIINLREGLPTSGALGWEVINQVEDLNEEVRACRWGLYELAANAIGGDHIAADVAHWCQRALDMGAGHPRLDQELLLDLIHVRKVPNAPFRLEFERQLALPSGFAGQEDILEARVIQKTYQALVRIEKERGRNHGAAGLMEGDKPQPRVFNRWLGITTYLNSPPRLPGLRLFVSYEQAEALALALDLSPHSAGI